MRDLRFLVVDDSAMARRLITSVIRGKLGSEKVLQAGDGREALLLLESNPVDIIISDWSMGKVNGDELLAYVRRNERLRHIPFIMVTCNAQRDAILTAMQLGVTHYLVKPFTPAELEQKIRSSWNAAVRRGTERYSDLPAHDASILLEGSPAPVSLLNLSRSGALLRLRHNHAIGLFRSYELSLTFRNPDSGQTWSLPSVPSHCVRLETDDHRHANCLMAVEFDAGKLDANATRQLDSLLAWLAARGPTIIDG
ncbi:MAG: response regulator [Thiohalomonadaceae bacterium]